jgi:MoxR-like ATPase
MDAAVREMQELVAVFRDEKEKFQQLGVPRVNRSLIICGPPGSGKTNLAYAFANEMGLPTKVLHCRLDSHQRSTSSLRSRTRARRGSGASTKRRSASSPRS